MPNIFLQNTSISFLLFSASELKVLSSLFVFWGGGFSLHLAIVHPELEDPPTEAKRGGAKVFADVEEGKQETFFFFLHKIKGWRVWTSQGQFHMPLRGPIVPAWNRTPLYVTALKNNVGPPHNRICGIPTGQQASATWNSLHWPWSGRAVRPPNNGNIDFSAMRILVEL